MQNQITFSQALEDYLLYADACHLSPHTIADYTNTFRKFQISLNDNPPITSITADQVRAFFASLDHLSQKTLLDHHTSLSALTTWAAEEGLVEGLSFLPCTASRSQARRVLKSGWKDVIM